MKTLLGSLLVFGALSWAHHSTAAEFDTKRLLILRGKVQKVEWINPHAWLYLEVVDPDGRKVLWKIEGASQSIYERRKFPKDILAPNVEISMTAYPAKNGETTADGATITFVGGSRRFFGGSAPVDGIDKDGVPCIPRANPGCRLNPAE